MKTKKELLRELGMREARRLGLADKWDQLLLASTNIVHFLKQSKLLTCKSDEPQVSDFKYLLETLKEFKGDL